MTESSSFAVEKLGVGDLNALVDQLERRILESRDPVERQRLIRELAELTKKETRG